MIKDSKMLNNILYKFIKIFLFILLTLAVMNILFFRNNVEWDFNYVMIYCFLIIYSLIIYIAMECFSKSKGNKINRIIKFLLIGIFFVMQLIYAILIRRNIGFDCGVIYGSAIDLVNGTFSNSEYFSMYGNNIFLLLVLEILFKIAKVLGVQNYLVIQIILNVIIIDIAIIYIYKICKKMFDKKYSKVCNLLSIPMLGITPYIAVVYSDTLSLIFPIAIFYNYLCIKQENEKSILKRIIYITLFTIVGILVKPTNVIILIAIIIVEVINFLQNIFNYRKICKKTSKNKHRKYLMYIVYIILTFTLIYGGFTMYKNVRLRNYISKEEIKKNSFPMTHFLMMGLKPTDIEGKYYGLYLEDDVQATKSHIGVDAKKEFNINEAKNRLKAMGINGYISFLYDKFTFIISDGTFFYGKEGNFYTSDAYSNGSIAKFIQNYAYQDRAGYSLITINIMQTIWIMLLVMCIIDICINFFNERVSNIDVLRLSAIGIILFILLFEARSRYLINYLPIFIILATSGIINLYKLITKKEVELIESKD